MFIARVGRSLRRCMPCGLILLLALAPLAGSQTSARSCPMIDGGGGIRIRDLEAIFSAAADAQGTTLRALVLVRAPAEFRSRSFSADKAQQYLMHGPHDGGGNVGPLRIVYNDATNVVWIDSLPIRFEGDSNLLLIEVAANDSIAVVGQAHMDPRIPIPPSSCGDTDARRSYRQVTDTLWARFQAIPVVRSFLSR